MALTASGTVTQIVVSNNTSVVAVPQCTQYKFRVNSTQWNAEILDQVFFGKKAQETMRESSGCKILLSNNELYTEFRIMNLIS